MLTRSLENKGMGEFQCVKNVFAPYQETWQRWEPAFIHSWSIHMDERLSPTENGGNSWNEKWNNPILLHSSTRVCGNRDKIKSETLHRFGIYNTKTSFRYCEKEWQHYKVIKALLSQLVSEIFFSPEKLTRQYSHCLHWNECQSHCKNHCFSMYIFHIVPTLFSVVISQQQSQGHHPEGEGVWLSLWSLNVYVSVNGFLPGWLWPSSTSCDPADDYWGRNLFDPSGDAALLMAAPLWCQDKIESHHPLRNTHR